jgi:hypothetical protein
MAKKNLRRLKMASIKDKIRKLVKEELMKVLEGHMDGENFSRMDALQGSNAMEQAFAAVDHGTLVKIMIPYLNADELRILKDLEQTHYGSNKPFPLPNLKDEILKIVMALPDAELEEIYDTVVAGLEDEHEGESVK